MRPRWAVANIAGAAFGIGVGIAVAQGLLGWVSQSPYFEETSGFPTGWSFYIALLLATLSGAVGAVTGYAVRQGLIRQRFVTKNAVWYALAGAAGWPIIGVSFMAVVAFVIAPLHWSLFPDVGVVNDRLLLVEMALASITLALPMGLAVAVLRRKEMEY